MSNRLPVVPQKIEGGETVFTLSPGGLVAAVAPALANKQAAWVGWSGSDEPDQQPVLVDGISIVPVSFSKDLSDAHYEGYSNGTLWPLFHDVGVPYELNPDWFDAYRQVNETFAREVASLVAPSGMVWVHDYQVMLLPHLIKTLRPDVTVGYFHHIPFPPLEILSALPEASEIVRGLAGADLIGFQRDLDSEHFRQALGHYLDTESATTPLVGTYPISIDFQSVSDQAADSFVQTRARELREEWGNPTTVFLGVDRIDYTKGIPERLEAFERLLDNGELSSTEAVFVQAGSPSRENVSSYQDLRRRIDGIVTRINSNHRAPDGRGVVWYLAENLPRQEMLALFVAADVMVVSSLRDGMNLVAKEFVACKTDETGVLVLSIHTGAADQMPEAVLVDPLDGTALSTALLQAAGMDRSEASRRMAALRSHGATWDVARWSREFLADLASVSSH